VIYSSHSLSIKINSLNKNIKKEKNKNNFLINKYILSLFISSFMFISFFAFNRPLVTLLDHVSKK